MRVAGSTDALEVESRLVAALREDPGSTIIMPRAIVTIEARRAGYTLTTSQILRAGRIAVDLRNETSTDLVVYVLDPGARHTSGDVEALIVRGVTTPPAWLKVVAGVSADADTSSVWNVEVDRGESLSWELPDMDGSCLSRWGTCGSSPESSGIHALLGVVALPKVLLRAGRSSGSAASSIEHARIKEA